MHTASCRIVICGICCDTVHFNTAELVESALIIVTACKGESKGFVTALCPLCVFTKGEGVNRHFQYPVSAVHGSNSVVWVVVVIYRNIIGTESIFIGKRGKGNAEVIARNKAI